MREPTHTNRLIHETSPYLRQHAHNPVDWYPWGPEALAKAKAENRPILLSVGYSACHWGHVMERESFEDAAIARLMNEHFVNIKAETVRQILDGLGNLLTFKEVAEPLDKELLDRIGRAGAGGTTGREGSASRKGAGGLQGDGVRLSQIHLFGARDGSRRPPGFTAKCRISNKECRTMNHLTLIIRHSPFDIRNCSALKEPPYGTSSTFPTVFRPSSRRCASGASLSGSVAWRWTFSLPAVIQPNTSPARSSSSARVAV